MPVHTKRNGRKRSSVPQKRRSVRAYSRRLRVSQQRMAGKSPLLRIPTITSPVSPPIPTLASQDSPAPRTASEELWFNRGHRDGRTGIIG